MTKETKQEDWFGFGHQARWIPGLLLVFVGVVLLLGNLSGYTLHNWWALFILSPALGSFQQAYTEYRSTGSFTRPVATKAFWGVFFVMLSASFLFNLSFGMIWPVFLILGGLMLLLGR